MKLHFVFMSALAFLLSQSPVLADAKTPHLDLLVEIDFEQNLIEISGSSETQLSFPENALNLTTEDGFSYEIALPNISKEPTRRATSFRGERSLYLPWGWYPDVGGLLTYEMSISSPWPIVAPGTLSNERQTQHGYEATFTMKNPTEGIPLFAGEYQIEEIKSGDLMLRTYFFKGMENLSQGYLERSAQYIKQFENEIGPFPFDAFHIIAADLPVGLGFAGMTYIGERVLRLPFIKETSLGHEILHNYWGNGVFPKYREGNWAEGLTTYQADYRTAELKSEELAKDMRLSWLRDYAALPASKDRSVLSFISKHDGASEVIGYHKAAYIFHMLRQKIGDEAFFEGLKHFWRENAFKSAGWDAIEASFTAVSGQDLKSFFKQWLTQTGAPEIVSATAEKTATPDGWSVETRLVQKNADFETFVPVKVMTETETVEKHITLSKKSSASKITIDSKPNEIQVDPDFNIFRKLGPNEAPPILREVMLAPEISLNILSSNMKEVAQQLGQRMVDGKIKDQSGPDAQIVFGLKDDVANFLKRNAMAPYAFPKDNSSSANVWADKVGDILTIFVAVRDKQALESLMRPLPHYGRRGALQFNGSKAIYKASATAKPITIIFQ